MRSRGGTCCRSSSSPCCSGRLWFVGEGGQAVVSLFERLSHVIFRIVAIVMKVAPIGAFGAMAYTVGAFGVRACCRSAG